MGEAQQRAWSSMLAEPESLPRGNPSLSSLHGKSLPCALSWRSVLPLTSRPSLAAPMWELWATCHQA